MATVSVDVRQEVPAPPWWLFAAAGVVFLVAGVMALLEPFQTFGILAPFVGWYLLIEGFFDVMTAVAFRHDLPMWGLTLAVGIAGLLLGFWALGYPGRSGWLRLVRVGTGALLRGIGNLVVAFAPAPAPGGAR